MANELFDLCELKQPQLTEKERKNLAKEIIYAAKIGARYSYTMKEIAGLLHWSLDQIFDALHLYKIDSFSVLGVVRIAWWSIAEYLIDPADDIEDLLYKYLNSLPHRSEDAA